MDFGSIYVESMMAERAPSNASTKATSQAKSGEISPSTSTFADDSESKSSSIDVPSVEPSIDILHVAPSTALPAAPCDAEPVEPETNLISYWVSINFIFGSLLYTSGSVFWTFDHYLTENDYFTLVTVAFFTGGTSFGAGSYMNYFSIINKEQGSNLKGHAPRRRFCCYSGKKSMNYYAASMCLFGATCIYINSLCNILSIHFEKGSNEWIGRMILYIIGGACFTFAGALDIYSNSSKSRKSWIISCMNCCGGFCYLVGAIGLFSDNELIIFWMAEIPYIIGSVLYLFTSIIGLWSWSKPHGVNINVLFIILYNITLAIAITAMIYASLCEKYIDWTKNFALGIMVSIAVLVLGSFMHKEQNKKPFKYIIWFSRCFMLLLTINLMIDTYRLSYMVSGYECQIYHHHDEFGAHR